MKSTAYLIQALLIGLWWLGLYVSSDFFDAFQFPNTGEYAFRSFLLPDIIMLGVLSVIRAYNSNRVLEYLILGAFAYATLYCINASILSKGGILPTTIMSLGLCYNLFLVFTDQMFKRSQTNNIAINALKTTIQIICVWTITLAIIPYIISQAFDSETSTSILQKYIGISLLITSSIFGLFSAYSIVKHGNGTPLPLDQTHNLVIKGPYKYIRNPMAVAGLGQGIGVSLLLGSFAVLTYVILGGLLWQFVVRPAEEKDMQARFGNQYLEYKRNVNCWWPSRSSSN